VDILKVPPQRIQEYKGLLEMLQPLTYYEHPDHESVLDAYLDITGLWNSILDINLAREKIIHKFRAKIVDLPEDLLHPPFSVEKRCNLHPMPVIFDMYKLGKSTTNPIPPT
jgi:hypothetical protein